VVHDAMALCSARVERRLCTANEHEHCLLGGEWAITARCAAPMRAFFAFW
jgi:hypothetical protein